MSFHCLLPGLCLAARQVLHADRSERRWRSLQRSHPRVGARRCTATTTATSEHSCRGTPLPLLSSHSTHFLFFRVQSSEHPASSHCLCRSPGLTSTTRPRRCSELQSEQATGSRLLGAPPEHGCSSEAALRLRLLGGGRGEKAVGWQRLAGNIVHTACEVTTEFTDVSWYHNMVCTLLWPQSGQHNFSQ